MKREKKLPDKNHKEPKQKARKNIWEKSRSPKMDVIYGGPQNHQSRDIYTRKTRERWEGDIKWAEFISKTSCCWNAPGTLVLRGSVRVRRVRPSLILP